MSRLRKWKRRMLAITAASAITLAGLPISTHADTPNEVSLSQGVGSAILDQANYFGDMDPNTVVTVDIVMKVQNKATLQQYINQTVTPGSTNYHKFLSVSDFKAKYAPSPSQLNAVTNYLQSFGIQASAYADNLIVTATGTVDQFNKAFNVDIQKASYKGKAFHGTKQAPTAPQNVAANILCILGLSDYSNLATNTKHPVESPKLPQSENDLKGYMSPQDLITHYNLQGLYDKGATGNGQTIGIVTLADFNTQDAYDFWKAAGLDTKPNRITKVNVDGGSDFNGYDETTLDVEQSGALAPQANINVYVAPNSDTGFIDGFAKAINDNVAQQLSVSWGESETEIDYYVSQNWETPEYAEVFNQLFMQAAAQGISMFAAAGDAGAYDTSRGSNYFDLSVDNPADSPYITAAGGTTLPQDWTSMTGVEVKVDKERAWSWDYLYPLLKKYGYGIDSGLYFVGGGGGFSKTFPTPDYQLGVPGVNTYTGVDLFKISQDYTTAKLNNSPSLTTGQDSGRNLPDLAMNADPETGYAVYATDPSTGKGAWEGIGGTSIVAPQLNGITALINSVNGSRIGFWNPQIYRFAEQSHSPFHPLNDSGTTNDNLFYTGTPGTIYNQATGLGTPDVTALANDFLGE